MAEQLLPVTGVSYSSNAFDDLFESLLAALGSYDATVQGPLRYNPWGYDSLAVTGTASPVAVASGSAWVKGKLYNNTAAVNVAVPTPTVSPRNDRIVLRLNFAVSPETCTIQRLAGVEGAGYPALTQTDGVTWEIPLAIVSISLAGAITVTDERVFVGDWAQDAATVLAKFGADSFTNAVLLQLIQDGSFQADAATQALFADNIWSLPKLAQIASLTVLGRASGAGNVQQLTAAANGDLLRVAAGVLGWGTIGATSIADLTDLQAKHVNVDTVDGLHAADISAGGIFIGAIMMWSGSLGGSDGHRPVVGGAAKEDWHLCNGDTVGGVITPDLRDRFPVGAGATYAEGATGGGASASHTHARGTMAVPAHLAHDHEVMSQSGSHFALTGGAFDLVTVSGGPTTHGTITGNTAAAAPSTLPPYYGIFYIMKVS